MTRQLYPPPVQVDPTTYGNIYSKGYRAARRRFEKKNEDGAFAAVIASAVFTVICAMYIFAYHPHP